MCSLKANMLHCTALAADGERCIPGTRVRHSLARPSEGLFGLHLGYSLRLGAREEVNEQYPLRTVCSIRLYIHTVDPERRP